MATNTVINPAKVVTGKVRLSYVHVFEPETINEGGDPKYSVSLLIPKKDKVTLQAINAAITSVKTADKSKVTWGGKVPADAVLKLPLRDGDEERPDDEAYAGMMFVNANASVKSKPEVIDKVGKPILNSDELYSGCFARVSVTFYAFNVSGNKGIACGLGNIMKVDEGDSLAGKTSAATDFADIIGAEDDLY
jgi:hypothetical protein